MSSTPDSGPAPDQHDPTTDEDTNSGGAPEEPDEAVTNGG